MDILHTFGVPQSPTTWDRSGNPLNQTRSDKSAPRSPSKATEGWTCQQPYRYSNPGTPKDASETFHEVLEKFDENLCKKLKEEIGSLTVVAGLFLAIVTAFTIDSYKLLQEDKQDELSKLLVEVVRLLNDTSTQGQAKLPTRSTPDRHDIVVNQLWFLSMILSLIAVLIGTFCLQWISAFLGELDWTGKSTSPEVSLRMHQLRRAGMVGWGVLHAPEALLLLVQLSIALFTSGLVYFLWNVNHVAAIPTLVVAGVAGVLLYLVNMMPFLQPLIGVFFPTLLTRQCPYKSPTSWLLTGVCDLLVLTLKGFQGRWHDCGSIVGRFSAWLGSRPAPWTDYLWKAHDSSYATLQDSWEVCSYTYSYVSGVSSALDLLVLEPDAVEIINSSLQNLPWRSKTELFALFGQTLNPTEWRLLKGGKCYFFDPNLHDTTDQYHHFAKLHNDFFTALVFQIIAHRSEKLRLILLQHRVELYTRIKNSSLFVMNDPNTPNIHHGFSNSLNSPFIGTFHPSDLDPELRFQFMSCIYRCIDKGLINNGADLLAAAAIIELDSQAPDVTEVTRPDSSYGKRGEQDSYNNFPGAQHTSGVCEATDTKDDTDPDVASPVSDAHGMDRPDCGGVNTDGQKKKGNASHSFSGAIHTNLSTEEDDKLPHSSQHDVYEKRAEGPLLRAKLRSVCLQVKEKILEIPKSSFKMEETYHRLQDLRYALLIQTGNRIPIPDVITDHLEKKLLLEGANV